MEKWIKCKECGHEFSNKLSKCPECGKSHLTVKGLASLISILAIVIISVIGLVLGFSEKDGNIPTASQTQSQKEEVSEKKEDKKEDNSSYDESSSKSEQQDTVSDVILSNPSKDNTSSSKTPSSSASESASSNQSSSLSGTNVVEQKNYETGVTIDKNYYYVTIPKYYLEYMYLIAKQADGAPNFEDFAYSLTTDRIVKNVSKVIKNPNGAATCVYTYEKYLEQNQNWLPTLIRISDVLEIYKCIDEVKYSKYFDTYDIKLTVDDLDKEEQASILGTGLSALEYQYFRRDSEYEVTINLTYKNGTKETIKVDEIIQQAMDEYHNN